MLSISHYKHFHEMSDKEYEELEITSTFDFQLFCILAEVILHQVEKHHLIMNRFASTNKERKQNLTIEELVEAEMVHSNNSLNNDWRESCYTIKDKLCSALHYGYFSDVKFVVGQQNRKEIAAHKFILSLASSVFEGLFEGSTPNKTVNVTVGDVEPDAFIAFLKFIYTDEFEVQVKDATAVLYLAKKYSIGKLVGKTGEFIMGNISCKNVVSVLLSAEAVGETSISTHARQFLRRNISYVIHEVDFLQLNSEELCQIFAGDELVVNELELFSAAIRWAVEECKRQKLDMTNQNYRYVLQNVLPLIRFPLMSRREFTFHVATKNILTDTECLNVLMHFDMSAKERANLPQLLFNGRPRKNPKHELETLAPPLSITNKEREFYESYYDETKGQMPRNVPVPPRRHTANSAMNQVAMRGNGSAGFQHSNTPVYNQSSWVRAQTVGLPMASYSISDYRY